MLKLERIKDKVYYNKAELKINKQSSKGPGHEAVDISELAEANGQKWISLSRLEQGINEIECKARNVKQNKKYELTKEEQQEVDKLQSKIDVIVEKAKTRYVAKPSMNVNVAAMSKEEKAAYIETLNKYLESLKA